MQAARERKTSLDAAEINVMRPKKNKRGKKAIQNTQTSLQPQSRKRVCEIGLRARGNLADGVCKILSAGHAK